MAPEFALFLSPDGIALAHRQPAGHWAVLADTALDVPDLHAALAGLREKGVARAGEGFATLVILPDDQILFTSITAPGPDDADREIQIRDGLDGLTPYRVDDLSYDYFPLEDGRVKLAVAARETLDEAEAFAREHGFEPVGFAARPLDNRYPGVAHFDRAPDWTTSIADIEFGHDSWHKTNDATEKDAPSGADDALEEAETTEDGKPEDDAAKQDDATEIAADATADPDAETSDDATADDDTEKDVESAEDDDPAEEETDETEDADPVATDDDAGVAKDTTASTPEDDADIAEDIAAATPDSTDSADAGSDADAGTSADTPAGFSSRRLRATPPETAGELVRTRASRFGVGARADAPADLDGTAPPELSRKPGETKGPQPRFGRGGNADSAEPNAPQRPSAAGPAPDLPPLTRTKLQAQRSAAAPQATPPERPAPLGAAPEETATTEEPVTPTIRARLASMRKPGSRKADTTVPVESAPITAAPPADAADRKPATGLSGRLKSLAPRRKSNGDQPKAAATVASPEDTTPATATPRRRFTPNKRSRRTPAPVESADTPLTGGLLARGSIERKNGPSLRYGLILTLILLAVLGLVAIWAAFYLPDTALARWIGLDSEPSEITSVEPDPPSAPLITSPALLGVDDPVDLASLTPDGTSAIVPTRRPNTPELLPDIDADLDLEPALVIPPPVDPETMLPSREENDNFYARTGIWQRPPIMTRPEIEGILEDVYVAGIDPEISSHDAYALPIPDIALTAELPRRHSNPVSPETEFVFDDNGLVVPTAEGALNPDGILIFAGSPSFVPPQRPGDGPVAPAETPDPAVSAGAIDTALLSTFRPNQRPGDLSEQRERSVLGGISLSELAAIRPAGRPASIQEIAAAEEETARVAAAEAGQDPAEITTTSDMAVAVSAVPATRPGNIDTLVAAARAAGNSGPVAAVVASPADTVQPNIPSSASVTRAATQENAINLRRINLIGITGTSSDRRALVRLPSGRFVTVEPGDRLDGGRVAAIGIGSLQYVKSGRTITLEMPAG